MPPHLERAPIQLLFHLCERDAGRHATHQREVDQVGRLRSHILGILSLRELLLTGNHLRLRKCRRGEGMSFSCAGYNTAVEARGECR